MNQAIAKTVLTGCLAPIDKEGLDGLIAKGKANPQAIKTLKCKTIAEGRFRHLNFIRSLPAYIVDEPPALLGDDTAPNPSEASLAALGSCLALGIHANAVADSLAPAPEAGAVCVRSSNRPAARARNAGSAVCQSRGKSRGPRH